MIVMCFLNIINHLIIGFKKWLVMVFLVLSRIYDGVLSNTSHL